MPIQVVIKKIEAKIHDQVKVCDMLVHQLKQWSQARDERQRHLQDLQNAETDPKWQEPELQVPGSPSWCANTHGGFDPAPAPPAGHGAWHTQSLCAFPRCLPQTIRQLGNDIEKMLMKIHSGEIVTNLYMRLQEVLRRVSSSSLCQCFTRSPCKGTGCPKGCVPGDTLLVPSVPCYSMGDPGG